MVKMNPNLMNHLINRLVEVIRGNYTLFWVYDRSFNWKILNFFSRSNTVENLSDSTASATGSDDEGGTAAATDGSTLRASPADNVEINETVDYDSGESNADSIVSASTNVTAADESVPDGVRLVQP